MRIVLTALFLLVCLISLAEGEPEFQPKKLQQLYLGLGIGGAFTNAVNMHPLGLNTSILLTATFKNNKIVRAGLLYSTFKDTQTASEKWEEDKHLINMVPFHTLQSFYVAVGKRIVIEKSLQFNFFPGISFTNYEEPINVTQRTAEFGFVGAFQVLDYEVKIHEKPGIILQAEAMVLPFRFAGLTLGGYYHFVPKNSNCGFNLSLNLGRIRPRESFSN
jgi:hypothetical protein